MGLVMDLDDLIGAAEAAKRAGLAGPRVVHTYVKRGRFPLPVKRLGSCDGWDARQVDAWRDEHRPALDTGG